MKEAATKSADDQAAALGSHREEASRRAEDLQQDLSAHKEQSSQVALAHAKALEDHSANVSSTHEAHNLLIEKLQKQNDEQATTIARLQKEVRKLKAGKVDHGSMVSLYAD